MFIYKKLSVVAAMALVATQGCFAHNNTADHNQHKTRQRNMLIAKVVVGTAMVAGTAYAAYRYSDRFKAIVDNALTRVQEAKNTYTPVVTQKVSQGWTAFTAGLQGLWGRAQHVFSRAQEVKPVAGNNLDVKIRLEQAPVAPVTPSVVAPEPMEYQF